VARQHCKGNFHGNTKQVYIVLYCIVLYCKFASTTIKVKALSRFRAHANAPQLYLIRTLTGSCVSRYLCKSNKRARLPFFNYPCNAVMRSCNEKCSDAAHSGLNAPDMKLSAPEDVAAVNCDLSSHSKCQRVSLCTRCFIPKLSRTVDHVRNIP